MDERQHRQSPETQVGLAGHRRGWSSQRIRSDRESPEIADGPLVARGASAGSQHPHRLPQGGQDDARACACEEPASRA